MKCRTNTLFEKKRAKGRSTAKVRSLVHDAAKKNNKVVTPADRA